MPRPTLYVAITNHGFGHATRTAAVLAQLQQQLPDLLLIVTTAAPRWLLTCYLTDDFIYRPRTFDVGVIQQDSFAMDLEATRQQLAAIQTQEQQLIASEANFIRQNRVNLIFADIPPLITKIAEAAGVPCWMCGNFGWDLIYQPWGPPFAESVAWIQDCFRRCDRLFRLPFHEPMSTFSPMIDVGLTGGSPRYNPDHLRTELGLHTPLEQTVLLTFGGLGLSQIPYRNLALFPDWQFITFAQNAPQTLPNLLKINGNNAPGPNGGPPLRPVDVMPLCGRVISKPGYGTFAEACRLEIPVASLPRTEFAEAQFLIDGLQNHNPHQLLAPGEFEDGDWDFLHHPPHPPKTNTRLDKTGNQAITTAIIDYLATIT